MLRIRLRRIGKKKQPVYRIVVADSRSPRDGAFVEVLGHYHPLDNPSTVVLDSDRARHWLDRGAQPSDRVWKLLAAQGIGELPAKLKTRIALGQQRAEESKKKPKAEAEEAAPAAEAPAAAPAEPTPAAEAAAPAEEPAAEAAAEEAPQAPAEEPASEEGAQSEAPAEPPAEEGPADA